MGRCGDFRPARLRRMARARRRDRLLLRDDALVELFFDAEELLGLFFLDAGDGDAGPAADDVLDVFAADDAGGGVVEVIFVAKSTQVFALFAFLV